MNRPPIPTWRKAKAPLKKRKLNDSAYKANPDFCNENLPIHSRRLDIMATLASAQVLIVQGDTGCGKTTQLPQFIYRDYPDSRIAVTQPRRLAAVGVARRVAREMGTSLGTEVGYHIRGEKNYRDSSRIIFMTTGMFIQELVGCSKLPYTHIIIDEVHERAIETEFLLVVLKHMIFNTNFKLILMSATINASLFANYYSDSEIERIASLPREINVVKECIQSFDAPEKSILHVSYEGERDDAAPIRLAGPRNFAVKEIYLEEMLEILSEDLVFTEIEMEEIQNYYKTELVSIDNHFYRAAAHLIRFQHLMRIYEEDKPQTFLIFLPGIHEITKMGKVIAEDVMRDQIDGIEICMLHSSIPEESHGNIFKDPEGKRRIIISTNIAESSITLPDVRYIIDFGLTKELVFNSSTKCERLQMQWACKAVMQQRAGRAGRVAEGVCFRLMPEDFYKSLRDHSIPEIQRCPLDKLVLKVKQLNLGTPALILSRAIQPPNLNEIIATEEYLREMGALTDDNKLTWLGRVYADMPCDVKISRLCLFGYIFSCLHECLLMGALMSQEKPIFLSFAHMDFKHSQYESYRYTKKLMWDNFRDSDPITALSAYKAWYATYGKNYVKNMKKSSFSHTKRPEVSMAERNWCKGNAVDYNVLREVCATFQELKRRLKYMGLAKQHLTNRLDDSRDNIITLKLCLAAAYNEKYLTSYYGFEDEVMRRKKEHMLKERQGCKVIIPGIPKDVTCEDIKEILKPTRAKNIQIDMERENAVVTFDPTESKRPLQMCLWLGTFPQRYKCGEFVVVKKYFLDKNNNRVESLQIENLAQAKQKVAYSQPREGMKIEVEHTRLGDKFVHIEAFCLQKPEYIYRLSFKDFLTGSMISLDESSVCTVALEQNAAFERCHMVVCCELVEKRNRTVASNITLMPCLPMLPHLLTMVFTKDIKLFEIDRKYGGFRAGPCEIWFNFTFSGKDIEEINDIRKDISEALFDEKGILNPAPLKVREKLFKLIHKKRLPLIEKKFKKLITHNEEKLNEESQNIGSSKSQESIQEDSKFNNRIQEDKSSSVTENDSKNNSQQSNNRNVNNKKEMYLKPLERLDSVIEDARAWTEEGQKKIELEMLQLRASKEEMVIKIKNQARMSKILRPEIICSVCKNTICAYFNASPIELTPVSGKFKLNCVFGSVRSERELPENIIMNQFVESICDQILDIEEWALCMEGHLIGWKTGDSYFINHQSPLELLMTDGSMVPWGSCLWRDGYEKFTEICRIDERTSKYKTRTDLKLNCTICNEEFANSTDFFNHVIVSKEHTENVTRFLRDGY